MMLALRPKIHSLETTHAYTLRLANANGLRRIPGALLERRISSGIAARTDLPGVSLRRLSELTGQDDKSLANQDVRRDAFSWHYQTHRLGHRHFSLLRRKICPACFDQQGITPWYWSIRLFTACPDHGLQLIDRCTACREPLSWRRDHEQCRCGLEYRRAEAPCASSQQVLVSKVILAAVGIAHTPQIAPRVPAALQVSDLERIALMLHHYRQDLPAGLKRDQSHAQQVGRFLEDWPRGFRACMEELQDSACGSHTLDTESALARLDEFTRMGTRWLRMEAPARLRDAFWQWLAGVGDAEELAHLRTHLGDFETYLHRPVSQLCQALGITRSQLTVLVDAKLLDYRPGTGMQFASLKSLARLIHELAQALQPCAPRANLVPISEVSPRCGRHRYSGFRRVVESILSGECPVYASAVIPPNLPLFQRMLVSLDDLAALRNPWATFRDRSLRHAAKKTASHSK